MNVDMNRAGDTGLCVHGNGPGCTACREAKEREKFFEVDPEQEKTLNEISQSLCARVEQIIAESRSDILRMNNRTDGKADKLEVIKIFAERARKLWPENDGRRIKPDFQLGALGPNFPKDVFVKFEYYNAGGEFGRIEGRETGGNIVLGIEEIIEARTDEEIDAGIQRLRDTVYHEVEHIRYASEDSNGFLDGSKEGIVRYLTDPGEIRAFAKQYAFRYYTAHPGEPFDIERMRSIRSRTVENYFVVFANPAKQNQYREYGDLAKAYGEIVRVTTALVDFFNSQS